MSKLFVIWFVSCSMIYQTDCNPIHDLRLDTNFIHEFAEKMVINMTQMMGSNSYSDRVGNWQFDNQRDIRKCIDGMGTTMWLISLPYIKVGDHELNWPDHRAIWINAKCHDGSTIPFTVDFSQSKGARRRFGFFNHDKIVLRGPDPLNMPIKKVYHVTDTTKTYNLLGYNCHHYADEMYEKLLLLAQGFHKDK